MGTKWSIRSDNQINFTPPCDRHVGDIAGQIVGVIIAKTDNTISENHAPPSFQCWALFEATQDLNSNYSQKIDTSLYNFVTGHHIDIKEQKESTLSTFVLQFCF